MYHTLVQVSVTNYSENHTGLVMWVLRIYFACFTCIQQ